MYRALDIFATRGWVSHVATIVACSALGVLFQCFACDAQALTRDDAIQRGGTSLGDVGGDVGIDEQISAAAPLAESRTGLPTDSPTAGSYVPLSDVVVQVQKQFHATAVRADTVSEDGELVYRIRLLSADKSHVWTVDVDARTGRLR